MKPYKSLFLRRYRLIGWPIKVAMPIMSENREFSRLTYGEQGVKIFCFLTWDRAGLGPCSHILPISHHSRTCAHFRLQKEQNKCGRVTISLPTSIYTFAHPMGCTCTHTHTDCQNGSLENARLCNFQHDFLRDKKYATGCFTSNEIKKTMSFFF